jgi:transcription termination factor Rho
MFDILELNKKLLPELREIAKELQIKRVESLKKQDLIYKILDQQAISIIPTPPKKVEPKKVLIASSSPAELSSKDETSDKPRLRERIKVKDQGAVKEPDKTKEPDGKPVNQEERKECFHGLNSLKKSRI